MRRAAQAPLEEQGFLGLVPDCFRALCFWRVVRQGNCFVPLSAMLGPCLGSAALQWSAGFGGGAGP